AREGVPRSHHLNSGLGVMLAVHAPGVKGAPGITKLELQILADALFDRQRPIKAAAAPSVTHPLALRLNPDPQGVLIAVDPYTDLPPCRAGARALSPQRLPRPAVEPGLRTFERARQRFVVHMRQHENVAGRGVRHHASDQSVAIELGGEALTLFDFLVRWTSGEPERLCGWGRSGTRHRCA